MHNLTAVTLIEKRLKSGFRAEAANADIPADTGGGNDGDAILEAVMEGIESVEKTLASLMQIAESLPDSSPDLASLDAAVESLDSVLDVLISFVDD